MKLYKNIDLSKGSVLHQDNNKQVQKLFKFTKGQILLFFLKGHLFYIEI